MSKSSSRGYNEFENWGEPSQEYLRIPDEVCQTVILGAVRPENPKIKLPVTENEDAIITLPLGLTRQNDTVRYTIKLNQHARAVQRLLRITTANKNDFRKCPPVPETLGKKRRMLKYQKPEVVINRGPYQFSIGQGPTLPLLCHKTVDDMLRKAVVIILAQAGFDRAGTSTINTLVDIVKSVMTRLTRLLHHLSQKDIIRGSFKDTVEKTLRDVGMTGIATLGEYWRKQVVGRKEKALNKSCLLFNTYTKLVNKLVSEFAHQSYHQFGHGFQNRSIRNKQDLLRSSRLLVDSPFTVGTSSAAWQI